MPKGTFLGEFELYVMGALLRLGDEAYGVTIRQEIEEQCGRAVAIGAVYATLARLETKGYVTFSISEPTPVPGGRSKKYARLTPEGRRALRHATAMLQRILPGLAAGGGRK
jgi:DNA-binding PadR family transcriptional regulator